MNARTIASWVILLIMLNVVVFHVMPRAEQIGERQRIDPVNSIAEFVIEVCLDIEDHQPGDERDAESEFFSLTKLLSIYDRIILQLTRTNYLVTKLEPALIDWIALPEWYSPVISPPPRVIC